MRKTILVATLAAVLAGAFSALSQAAASPGSFEASGSFAVGDQEGAVLGGSSNATKREFLERCEIPASQGVEAYVVQLPESFSSAGDVVVEWARHTFNNDIYLEFYGPNCEENGEVDKYDSDVTTVAGSFSAGTRYILVSATNTAVVEFTLTARPTQSESHIGQVPDPQPTASSSPTAVPSPHPSASRNPDAPREVSLTASKTEFRGPGRVRLSGAIDGGAECAVGESIELQAKARRGQAFKTVVIEVTDDAGGFSARLQVRRTTRFRALLPALDGCSSALSNVVRVTVS